MHEKKKSLADAQKSVDHLRFTLKKYRIVGVTPPVSIYIELKMAKLLATLESVNCLRVYTKD